MIDRKRSIDIEKIDSKDIDLLSQQLGEKVRIIVDDAVEKANKLLNIYGLQAKMQIALEPKVLNKK
jgi:hypothetical protein